MYIEILLKKSRAEYPVFQGKARSKNLHQTEI